MDTLLTSATFWSILDNLSEGIAILEVDGSILYVNEAAKKILQIYQPVSDLAELHKSSGRQGQWNRWKQLLNPPRQAPLETRAGTVVVKSQLINWNNHNLIQLLFTSSVQITGIPENATSADFHQYIHQLTEENHQLLKRAEQIERLEIISDAS
ncbi:MAG: PAS domain-containing protein, partial [Anaerolineales bacterium]|nr:PAS domain-containing protein [Anaerolineales bacterium]